MPLTWSLLIDWDGDGVGTEERDRMVHPLTIRRGRRSLFSAKGFGRMRPGELRITVDNFDKRYTVNNASSPLFPDVRDGVDVRLSVNDGVTDYDLFRGIVTSITTRPNAQHAKITVKDGWHWLNQKVQRDADTNVLTGTAIDRILAAAEYPEQFWSLGISLLGQDTFLSTAANNWSWGTDIDPGVDIIPIWWTPDFTGGRQINDLTDSENGFVFVATDGQFTFRDRDFWYGAAADVIITESEVLRDIMSSNDSDVIRNRVFVESAEITQGATADIWTATAELVIGAGQIITFVVDFTNPAIDVITPMATTDYTMFSETGGGGTNITSDLDVGIGIGSVKAEITLTNNGSRSGFINLLKVRGDPLARGVPITGFTEDTVSTSERGFLDLVLTFLWQQDAAQARDYSDWLISWTSDTTTVPNVKIQDRPSLQFAHDLGAVINADIDEFSVDDDFRLGFIEHRSTGKGLQLIETTWRLERFENSAFWLLGDSALSRLGQTTKLGY